MVPIGSKAQWQEMVSRNYVEMQTDKHAGSQHGSGHGPAGVTYL